MPISRMVVPSDIVMVSPSTTSAVSRIAAATVGATVVTGTVVATTAGVAAFGLAAPVGETHRDDASATRVVHR